MSLDLTQIQGGDELERSAKLSQQRGYPPCDVPGYDPRRFLGNGAYGEVWVAIDRTTGRQVAIKFYLHRGGLDLSLLSHEVEKLVFLSADRYVVQLLDVGWDAEPPYYVMEYVENGSLEDRLSQHGRLPAAEATALVREIAVGLMHAHGKGVLHCDLKPANVLLDQDGRPRLADFGQSRLSHEQTPALGTMFYMAPEQSDLKAVPDARWDVYALGAIFYAMLVGHPPHRHERSVTEIESQPNLEGRLERYRRLIEESPPPTEHRRIRGVDKMLAAIVDRALAADPRERFPTMQSLLGALEARQQRRSRRPLMVLGALGPLLLLAIMSVVGWLWFSTAIGNSNEALTQRALQGLRFAARGAALGESSLLEARFYDVKAAAADPEVVKALAALEDGPKTRAALASLADPEEAKKSFNVLADELRHALPTKTLENCLAQFDKEMIARNMKSSAWFITDTLGVQVAHWYASDPTFGKDYGWRSYFYGGAFDQDREWRPGAGEHLQKTQLSAAYVSNSSDSWVVAISTPVYQELPGGKKRFLGVIGVSFPMTTEKLVKLPEVSGHFAALVYAPEGVPYGVVLHHPLLETLTKNSGGVQNFLLRLLSEEKYRVSDETLKELKDGVSNYHDPIGVDEEGTDYRKRYLAAQAPIEVRGEPTHWLVVVEAPYDRTIGAPLEELRASLLSSGAAALAVIGVVIGGLWWFVVRMIEKPVAWKPTTPVRAPAAEMLTLSRAEDS